MCWQSCVTKQHKLDLAKFQLTAILFPQPGIFHHPKIHRSLLPDTSIVALTHCQWLPLTIHNIYSCADWSLLSHHWSSLTVVLLEQHSFRTCWSLLLHHWFSPTILKWRSLPHPDSSCSCAWLFAYYQSLLSHLLVITYNTQLTFIPTVLHSRTHLIFALALHLWPWTHFFVAPNGLFGDQQGLLLIVQQVAIEHLEAGMDWPNTSMPYIPDSKSRIPRIPLLLPNEKLQKYLSLHPLHSISPHHSWHPLTGLLLWHPLTDLLLLHPPALTGLVLSHPLTGLILSCPLMSILLLPLSFSLMHLRMLPLTPILILILSVDFLSRLLTQLPTHHLACHLTHLLAHLLTHHPIRHQARHWTHRQMRRQACHQACHQAHLLVLPLIPISWTWT